jgi:archaetidylinositol phosphate synthase
MSTQAITQEMRTQGLPKEFRPAARINAALTASVERQALHWLAERAPAWVTSDQLTVIGLAAQIGAGVCYALARYNTAALIGVIVSVVLNWLGDSLDGTLARVRCQQRPRYGFYVDHMVDLFGAVALMVGMGCSGMMHWQVALAMLVAFMLLSAESYLATYTLSRFQMSQGVFGPTEIRILMIVGTLVLLHSRWATIFHHRLLLFDIGGTVAAAVMTGMAVATTLAHTAELYREEPLP